MSLLLKRKTTLMLDESLMSLLKTFKEIQMASSEHEDYFPAKDHSKASSNTKTKVYI